MCGACRHSCNPFRNDHLPFFLRHRKARRRNQGAQQSRRQSAIIASCKAIIRRNAIETSRSCVLTDIMWRSALWWRRRNWRKGMKTLPLPRTRTVDCYQGTWRLYTRIFWSVRIDKQERIGEFRHFKAILNIFAHSDDKIIIRKILTAQRTFFFVFRQNVFSCLVVWLRNKISINKNI